jgi:hypothetical protein
MAGPVAAFRRYLDAIVAVPRRRPAGARQGAPASGALVRQQGLEAADAVAVMVALVESAGAARPRGE